MSEDCPEPNLYSTIPTTGVFGKDAEGNQIWPSAINPGVNGNSNESYIPVLTQGFQGRLSTAGWTKGNEGYKQQTFLGASISNFSVTNGVGNSSSTLNVTLVNDEYNVSDGTFYGSGDDVYHKGNGDEFKPPVVGSPVFFKFGKQRATVPQAWLKTYFEKYNGYFVPEYVPDQGSFTGPLAQLQDGRYIDLYKTGDIQYQTIKQGDQTWYYEDQLPPKAIQDSNYYPWADLASQIGEGLTKYDFVGWNHFVFGGILTGYSQKKGGSNTFDVSVSDPREILSNVQLVLNDYQGTTFNNKNMYNIYGFLEYDLEDSFKEFVEEYSIGKSELTKDDQGFFTGNDTYSFPPRIWQSPDFTYNSTFGWSNLSDEDIVKLSGPPVFPITGQGFARRASRGMPMFRINQALSALFSYDGQLWGEYERAGFGGPIDFRGYNYVVDLGGIPFNKIPSMYFIEQNQMDLLSYIQEITEVINHDYQVSLLPVIDAPPTASLYAQNMRAMNEGRFGDVITGIIRIDTIDRSVPPKYGAVKEYLNFLSAANAVSSESDKVHIKSQNIGYDLSNVTTDKFVVGGQEVNMYTFARNKDSLYRQYLKKQSPLTDEDNYDFLRTDQQWDLDTMLKQQVLPFYGFLGDKSPTIPIGFGPFQQIMLDSSDLDAVNVGNYYVTTEMELRAASMSYSAWSQFLTYYNERYGELTDTPIPVEEITTFEDFGEYFTRLSNGEGPAEIREVTSEPIPFEITNYDYIKDNFNFDSESILDDDTEVKDSQIFARNINAPVSGVQAPDSKFWRVDSMSVPRCAFNSSKPAVDSDGLPVDVCQPPYGFPLYYKRGERLGAGGGGFVDILQDIKSVMSSQERLTKEMKEKDPAFGYYAEFRDSNKVLKLGQAEINTEDIGEKLKGSQDQFLAVNFDKFLFEKVKKITKSIFGQETIDAKKEANERPEKFKEWKEQTAPLRKTWKRYRANAQSFNKYYKKNYMAVKNVSSQNGQNAESARKGVFINLDNARKVHTWLKDIADKHLGKTFLVKMPKNANINYKYKMGPNGIINGQGAWVDSGPFGFPPLKNIGDVEQPFPKLFKPELTGDKDDPLNKELFNHFLKSPSGIDDRLKWTEGALRTSYNPIEGDWEHNYKPEPQGGYFDWNVWSSGLDKRNRIFPQLPDKLTEGYRIKPYVRFDHSQFYDFKGVSDVTVEEIPSTARTEDFIADMYNGFSSSEFIRKPGQQKDRILQEKKDNFSYVQVSVDEKLYLAPKTVKTDVKIFGQRMVWKNTDLISTQTLSSGNKVVNSYTVPPIIYRPGSDLFWKENVLIEVDGDDDDAPTNTKKWSYEIPDTITASGFYWQYFSGTSAEVLAIQTAWSFEGSEAFINNSGIYDIQEVAGFSNGVPFGEEDDPNQAGFGFGGIGVSKTELFFKKKRSQNFPTSWIRDLAGGVDLQLPEDAGSIEIDEEGQATVSVPETYEGYPYCGIIDTITQNLESNVLGGFYTFPEIVEGILEQLRVYCNSLESGTSEEERYEGTTTKITDFNRTSNDNLDADFNSSENKIIASREDLDPNNVYALVTLPGRVNANVEGFLADGLKNNSNPIQYANMFSSDVVFKGDFQNGDSAQAGYANTTTYRLKGIAEVADEEAPDISNTVNNLPNVIKFFQDKGVQYPFGSPETVAMFSSPSPIMPHLFVLPLMSKERCYGPWISAASGDPLDRVRYSDIGGRVEFVKDESITPWNYGGYGAMNEVGLMKSQFSNSLQLFTEKGSFTVADAPTGILVGSPLVGGGPLVTSVSVSVSNGEVSSSINMDVYGSKFGKLTKQKEDQLASLTRERQKQLDRENELKRKGIYKSRENNLGVPADILADLNAAKRQIEIGKEYGFLQGNTTQNTIVFNGNSVEELANFVDSSGSKVAKQSRYESFVSIQADGYKQQVESEIDNYIDLSILRQQAAETDLNSMFIGYDKSVYNPYMPSKDFIQKNAINRRMRF